MQQKTAPNAEDQDMQDVADEGAPEPASAQPSEDTPPPLDLEP